MNIWESYQNLPPLERVIVTFTITILLIIVVYRVDKWFKNRRPTTPGVTTIEATGEPFLYGNLEQKANGTLVAYIAYWRYLIFGALYVAAFYFSLQSLIYLYKDLPPQFWKHWDKQATITCVLTIVVLAIPFLTVSFLKSNYKKVQLEIGIDRVRYLRSGGKGGTLLSDSYIQVYYKDITGVSLRQNVLGIGIIDIIAPTRTDAILLLLPTDERTICYRMLDEAIKKWKSKI